MNVRYFNASDITRRASGELMFEPDCMWRGGVGADIRGKVVEAVSLAGLGGCQLQWDELANRDLQFLSDPKQVQGPSHVHAPPRSWCFECQRRGGCVQCQTTRIAPVFIMLTPPVERIPPHQGLSISTPGSAHLAS